MLDGFIAIMNVATMKLDRRCFFTLYWLQSHVRICILIFRNTTFSQNTVLSPSLRSYFVDRCVKQFPKCESNSFIVRIKREKISCDLPNIFDDSVKRFKEQFSEIV